MTITCSNIYDIIKIPKYISKTAFQTVEKYKNTILTEKHLYVKCFCHLNVKNSNECVYKWRENAFYKL